MTVREDGFAGYTGCPTLPCTGTLASHCAASGMCLTDTALAHLNGEPHATGRMCEWTIRDASGAAGDDYGWWPRESAERILARWRSHRPEDGPFVLVKRTWVATDSDEVGA